MTDHDHNRHHENEYHEHGSDALDCPRHPGHHPDGPDRRHPHNEPHHPDHKAGHSHQHDHGGLGHSHVPAGSQHRWRLKAAFVMVAVFFGVELGIGLWSGSLTLQGDAGHMAVDLIGLGIALFATSLATRPDSTGRMTYGRYRAEIFSAGFSAALMFTVSIYIVIEAIHRWSNPHQLAPLPILVVGALGLGINIASLVLLQGGSKESLNIKGAYLEVMADALGSIGIIVAAALTMLTGTSIWDSLIAAAIAVFIFVRAFGLGREVLAILGQQAPKGISPKDAHDALAAVPGVDEVHDLHLWALTSGMNVATAHLVSETESEHCRILADAAEVMRAQFGIDHATLQVETSAVCHRTDW